MAAPYVKQPWVDHSTPADAAHMLHIEDGIAAADDSLTYRGDYSGATTYYDGDIVVGTDGFPYVCVQDGVTTAPVPFPGANGGIPLPVQNGKWVRGVGGAAVWSSLATDALSATPPASPVDGQLWSMAADATNGVIWTFRYNAGSASAYKWEFFGGADLFAVVGTVELCSSTSLVDLATPGPSITVPRAGDYNVMVLASLSQASGVTFSASASVLGAPVAAFDTMVNGAGAGWRMTASGQGVATALTAGTLLKVQYSTAAATVNFYNRKLFVRPVRVS